MTLLHPVLPKLRCWPPSFSMKMSHLPVSHPWPGCQLWKYKGFVNLFFISGLCHWAWHRASVLSVSLGQKVSRYFCYPLLTKSHESSWRHMWKMGPQLLPRVKPWCWEAAGCGESLAHVKCLLCARPGSRWSGRYLLFNILQRSLRSRKRRAVEAQRA